MDANRPNPYVYSKPSAPSSGFDEGNKYSSDSQHSHASEAGYSANAEPVDYPDTLPICKSMENEEDNPKGHPCSVKPQKPGRYNIMGADLLPPSYLHSIRAKDPYPSRGYQPGPGQVNRGWASSQTTQVSVIGQPVPNSRIVSNSPDQVADHVYLSFFVAFCCCPLLGVIGMCQARVANRLKEAGMIDQAKEHARTSLIVNIVGIVLGIVISVPVVVILFKYYKAHPEFIENSDYSDYSE